MHSVKGKTAFVTGAASGIGLAIARRFLEVGMSVAIADLQQDRLHAAEEALRAAGGRVHMVMLDVTDREAYSAAADAVERALGPVHILCNNAGIGVLGRLSDATYHDWDWNLGVNLGGVVNGVQTFLPRMLAHGQGGHILSTASGAGLSASEGGGIYVAAKMAVVGFMEVLRAELADSDIGVSVLCPHLVRSNIFDHAALRPARFAEGHHGKEEGFRDAIRAAVSVGMDPADVAEKVLRGILADDLYIITHPELKRPISERFAAILASIPDEPVDPDRLAMEEATMSFKPYRDILDRQSGATDAVPAEISP